MHISNLGEYLERFDSSQQDRGSQFYRNIHGSVLVVAVVELDVPGCDATGGG
jgi:hypothetical protein